MLQERVQMSCGKYQAKSSASRHRKSCISCKTVEYLKAQILVKNNELEDKDYQSFNKNIFFKNLIQAFVHIYEGSS